MASGNGTRDLDGCLRSSVLARIHHSQQVIMNKLDAVQNAVFTAVADDKYATPHFSDKILNEMYKFYKEGQFCDFQIKVENQVFKVHRLVMSSSSDYFRAMFSHDVIETRLDSTDLKELTIKGMEPLIEYAYTGRLDLALSNITDVMSGATFLQVAGAIDLCVTFLKENVNFENADELLKIGDMFSVPSLKEYYRNYLLENFLLFCESEAFLRIDADSLADYLSDDGLITTSESVLFHHCLNWYNYNAEDRERDAHKVFEKIRMSVDGWPLIHQTGMGEPFLSNLKCQDIKKFHTQYMHNATKRYINNTSFRTRVRSKSSTIVQFGGVMQTDDLYDTFQDMLNQPMAEQYGWDQNNYFHPDLKSWFPLGIVGHWISRLSHQVFVEVNGCGVIVGGYEYSLDGDSVNKIAVSDVKMFTAQGSFQLWDMKGLQHPRARHTAVYLDGHIFAIGGKDDKQALRSVECLDCQKEEWSYVRALPSQLFDHAAAVCQGKIYVSGGSKYSREVNKTVWCYTPGVNNWKKMRDMNSARAGHGMVCLEDHLYVAGGHNGNREASNPDGMLRCLVSMEMYNVSTNQWTQLKGMKQGITYFQMKVLEGKIVVLGGLDTSGQLTQYMHEYDHLSNTWKVFGEMPRPLRNACCGVITVKLTDTGCMEDLSDEYLEEYSKILEEHEEIEECEMNARIMENFEPGDYLLDEDSDACDHSLDDYVF